LQDFLNDIEYLISRGLHLLLSSSVFKYVQDRYQIPTAFDSKEKYAKAIAFAVGCDYWSAIHVDDDYYYTSLYCISDEKGIYRGRSFQLYGNQSPLREVLLMESERARCCIRTKWQTKSQILESITNYHVIAHFKITTMDILRKIW
jgi:hypothetical protein